MKEYKNDLRIRVQARKGSVEPPDLNTEPGYETSLDKEIIACASRCARGQRLIAFFCAYHCAPSWENIQDLFQKHLSCELEIATVQRYARDAANRIEDRMGKRT